MLLHVMIGKPTCLHRVGGNECDGNGFGGLTRGGKGAILVAIKKAMTEKKLCFRGQREGRPG